jgi:hypothetical protein
VPYANISQKKINERICKEKNETDSKNVSKIIRNCTSED